MTRTISALLGVSLMIASPAMASDIFGKGGSVKDTPGETYSAVSRSGVYITGALGFAGGDRDINSTINGQKNYLGTPCEGEEDGCENGFRKEYELGDGQVAGPVIFTDRLVNAFSDDVDALVFGGELSYMFHLPSQRFAVEFGLGGTFYGDNETKRSTGGTPTVTSLGDEFPSNRYPDVGEPNVYNQTGQLSFERDFDIDLVAKGHVFVRDNLSLYAGAGFSWARASLKGSHVSDYGFAEGAFSNGFKEDDASLGYVLLAGVQWWATDRITVGLEYSYKEHEFDFSAGGAMDAEVGRGAYRYSVSDKVDVEDKLHAVKGRVGVKF